MFSETIRAVAAKANYRIRRHQAHLLKRLTGHDATGLAYIQGKIQPTFRVDYDLASA